MRCAHPDLEPEQIGPDTMRATRSQNLVGSLETLVTDTFHALLDGLIDYAGLFPPAQLDMPSAMAEFLAHRGEPASFLLAHFVAPAARLPELATVLGHHPSADPVRLAVLARGGADAAALQKALDADLRDLLEAARRLGERLSADVIELRLPEHGLEDAVVGTAERLARSGPWRLTPFFEPSLLGDWRPRLARAGSAVSDLGGGAGLKIRCGGLDAAAVPSVEAVAAAISVARDGGLLLKATQGLHHPLRHHDETLGAVVHGFLNVVAAAVMARVHGLDTTEIGEIVAEQDGASFTVTTEHLAWRGLTATAAQVRLARRETVVGFGSCSFTEPRDDLRALGLLPPV
jgi:hypothetical protein